MSRSRNNQQQRSFKDQYSTSATDYPQIKVTGLKLNPGVRYFFSTLFIWSLVREIGFAGALLSWLFGNASGSLTAKIISICLPIAGLVFIYILFDNEQQESE